MTRLLFAVSCASLGFACTTPSLDAKPFACATDSQCGDGWFCGQGGVCVVDGTPVEAPCTAFYDDPSTEFFDRLQAGDPCATTLAGICATGKVACADGVAVCQPEHQPGQVAETCNRLDDDCDGATDNGFDVGSSCDANGDGCFAGRIVCAPDDATKAVCDETGQGPTEVCDGLDNDCDGATDEDVGPQGEDLGAPCVGVGSCGAGTLECGPGQTVRCSSDPGGTTDKSVPEACNGLDDDCDGATDETYTYDGAPIGSSCDSTGVCGVGRVECLGATSTTCSTNSNGSDPRARAGQCGGADLVVSASGATCTEGGASATVSVQLSSPPSTTVLVLATLEPEGAATVSPASLPFNSANWDEAKKFTVSAVDDWIDDGDAAFTLRLYVQTTDPLFSAVVPNPIALTAVDNDSAGIVTQVPDNASNESGGTAEVRVSLATQPLGKVRLTVSQVGTNDVRIPTAFLEFGVSDWSTPKPIVITGQDDHVADGDTPYRLRLAIDGPRTEDPTYRALPTKEVPLISIDGVCGNELVDGDEACDGSDPSPCRELGVVLPSSVATCSGACQSFDNTRCGWAFVDVASSPSQACAIGATGELTCWNRYTSAAPPALPTTKPYTRVVIGDSGSSNVGILCGLANDRTIACLSGVGPSGSDFVDLDAGKGGTASAACAVRSTGAIVCFGTGAPTAPVTTGAGFTQVAVGQGFACGLSAQKSIVCVTPVTAPVGSDFVALAASSVAVCGLRATGALVCEGVSTPPGNDWTDLSATSDAIIALRSNGTAWVVSAAPTAFLPERGPFTRVFGRCALSATGGPECGDPAVSTTPWTLAPSGFGWRELLPPRSNRGAGIRGDGRFFGWVRNSVLRLGAEFHDFIRLAASPDRAAVCALRATGAVLCDGIAAPPADLLASDLAVYATNYACAIVKPAKTLRCWGSSAANYPPPAGTAIAIAAIPRRGMVALDAVGTFVAWAGPGGVAVGPNGAGFAEIVGAEGSVCARRASDGSVSCAVPQGYAPVTLPSPNSGFVQIDALEDTSHAFCGVRSDGSITCWGSSAPAAPTGPDFTRVFLGTARGSYATRADGTVVPFDASIAFQLLP